MRCLFRKASWILTVQFILCGAVELCAEQPGKRALAAPSAPADIEYPATVTALRSKVYVLVHKSGLVGHEHGVEGSLSSGTLQLGASANAGQLEFDMTTFDADTAMARQAVRLEGETDDDTRAKVNANLRGPAVLDVARFPRATYKIDSSLLKAPAQGDRPATYELRGTFTLHGTSQPLAILVAARPEQELLRVWGRFSILQTQYGITPFSKAFGAVGVADRLDILGDLWLQSAKAPVAPASRTKPAGKSTAR